MRCPTLKELPSPPPDRSSWPWTEESPQLPDTMSDGSQWPKISIVTPNLNNGQFIEDTILSVINQNYPNLEYIIIDGGSTDNSVDIIKKYEKYLTYWVSNEDNGQAEAINRGFSIASGEILGWLNADDLFLPSTLVYISDQFDVVSFNSGELLFGNCIHLNETTNVVTGSDVENSHNIFNIELCDYIIQPSSFWTRKAYDIVGPLQESMRYGFDWDWFIRAKQKSIKFRPIKKYLSIYRIHPLHKSSTGGKERVQELYEIYNQYHGERLASAYIKMYQHQGIKIMKDFFFTSRLYKIINLDKLIWRLYFRQLSINEYVNLRRM